MEILYEDPDDDDEISRKYPDSDEVIKFGANWLKVLYHGTVSFAIPRERVIEVRK